MYLVHNWYCIYKQQNSFSRLIFYILCFMLASATSSALSVLMCDYLQMWSQYFAELNIYSYTVALVFKILKTFKIYTVLLINCRIKSYIFSLFAEAVSRYLVTCSLLLVIYLSHGLFLRLLIYSVLHVHWPIRHTPSPSTWSVFWYVQPVM